LSDGGYGWLTYVFPIFRLGDFFIGCSTGKILKENDKCVIASEKSILVSVFEVLLLILTIVVYVFTHSYKTESRVIVALQKNGTTIWIPLALLWVIVFIFKRGYISSLLTNRFVIWVEDLSAYLFLIHYIVLNYINGALSVLGFLHESERGLFLLLRIMIGFVVSIVLTLIYLKISRKITPMWDKIIKMLYFIEDKEGG